MPFFDGFYADELQRVAELAEEVEAEKGAVLVDQGRVGQECYVILEGEASVYVSGEHIATSGPGSMVGEMALVEHQPRNASVVAETPMKLIVFDLKALQDSCCEEMPEVNRRVMATLVARMQQQRLSGPARRGADALRSRSPIDRSGSVRRATWPLGIVRRDRRTCRRRRRRRLPTASVAMAAIVPGRSCPQVRAPSAVSRRQRLSRAGPSRSCMTV